MKKILYIIAATTLCLTACQKELSEVQSVNPAKPEVATVTVPFTVTINTAPTAPTRGDHDMAEVPVLKNLYIAIFGEDGGMLQQFVPATMVTPFTQAGYAHKAEYTAQLPLYDDECHLHFIGNFEGDVSTMTFAYEKDFIDNLSTAITTTKNGNYTTITSAPGAYWQKVILTDGIKAETDPTSGNLVIARDTKAKLTPIALVRNYAKLTVSAASTAKFTVESYALVNVPYQGTIAPYDQSTHFGNKYTEIGKYCDGTYNTTDKTAANYHNFVTDLMATKYPGYMGSNDLIMKDNPGESAAIPTTADGLYLYERTVPTRNGEQTGLIVKLKWKTLEEDDPDYACSGKTYYYKIEVLDENGEYLPICRNVHYNINLTQFTGEGYTSFDQAYEGPFFGNVSSSLETATLTTINDNIRQIAVNRMDYFSVNGEDVVDLYFKFWLNMTGEPCTSTSNYQANQILAVSPYDQAIASVSPVEYINDSNDAYNGWMHVQVTLKPKEAGKTLRGKLRIQGILDDHTGVGSLYRDVVFTVMEVQDFTSETTITSVGSTVTLNIGIPEDLPFTMFPLQIKIEALNNNLTTNSADLPVSYGPSVFTGKNNTFYFLKTIQYKDYVDTSHGVYEYTTQFPCNFQNLDTSKNLVVNLTEINGYFHPKQL